MVNNVIRNYSGNINPKVKKLLGGYDSNKTLRFGCETLIS